MARPQKYRLVERDPEITYFKPRGIPLRVLAEVRLTVDQREAMRLADLESLSQEAAGERMGVSRATFGRILNEARRRVADAVIHGKAIVIEGGSYHLREDATRRFQCHDCLHLWEEPFGTGRPASCPACGGADPHRLWNEADDTRDSQR